MGGSLWATGNQSANELKQGQEELNWLLHGSGSLELSSDVIRCHSNTSILGLEQRGFRTRGAVLKQVVIDLAVNHHLLDFARVQLKFRREC